MIDIRRLATGLLTAPKLKLSPDGRWLAGVSAASVRVWGLPNGAWRDFDRDEHGDYPLKAVAFSPDSHRLATGGGGGAGAHGGPLIQDVRSGEVLFGLEARPASRIARDVFSLAFSADGQRIADGAFDGIVRLWDAADGGLVGAVAAHPPVGKPISAVQGLAFSPTENLFATGATDGTVKLWDANELQLLQSFNAKPRGVNTVAFSHDGQLLAAAGWSGFVKVWSVPSGTLVAESNVNAGSIRGLAWHPSSHRLVTVGDDAGVRIWNVGHPAHPNQSSLTPPDTASTGERGSSQSPASGRSPFSTTLQSTSPSSPVVIATALSARISPPGHS